MTRHDVNLVPRTVRSATEVRKVLRALTWGIGLILALTAGIWLLQSTSISAAQARLDEARAQTDSLGKKVSDLAPIGGLYQQLTEQEGFIAGALASQARASEVLAALAKDAGPTVDFTNVALTLTGIPRTPASPVDSACPDADPFSQEISIGCLSFSASGKDRKDVSDFLLSAQADPLFVNPYVTTTTISESSEGASSVTFSGSVGISLEGLSTLLTDEEKAELAKAFEAAAAAAANPNPAASPSATAEVAQ